MRLISQNGKIDVPYDKVILGICDQNNGQEYVIYAYHNSPRPLFIATYSNTDKALKVMEMLREQYMKLGMIKILASGTCEYMDKSLEKEEKMDIYTDYCRKHCFKFPADEEVEV